MPNAYHPSRCCVLVASCDAYRDLWTPFFDAFFRHWPDCPFPIYLLYNNAAVPIPRVRPIATGTDVSWSTNLKKGLEQIKEEFVLLFLEDLFLTSPVNTARIEQLVAWSIEHSADCTKLLPIPPPDRPENEIVGGVSPGSLYRVSTVLTLWKRTVLDALLVGGENAWEFEHSGSLRSDRFSRFYAAHNRNFTFVNGVIRGKWCPGALRFLRQLGIQTDATARPELSKIEQIYFRIKIWRYSGLQLLPARHRRLIRGLLTQSAKL